MSFAEVLLNLPEDYGAIYSLFYGSGFHPVTGLYSPLDANGNKRPLLRVELGQRIIPESTLNYLLGFFNTYGSTTGFRLRSWIDYQLVDVEQVFVANEALTIQMVKSYTVGNVTTYKAVHKPVQGTIEVVSSGSGMLTEGEDYTINYTTGVITTADTFQGYLFVNGLYDTPVSFDLTPFNYSFDSYSAELQEDLYYLESLVLTEIPYNASATMPSPLTALLIEDVTLPTGSGPATDTSFEEAALSFAPDFGALFEGIGIHQLAAGAIESLGLLVDYSEIFDVGSVKAAAFVAATLLELRRLMPFGLKWFSPTVVDNISTVIGSMLYAESEMYYAWALYLYATEKEASPYTVKFEAAQDWFKILFGRAVTASDGLLRQLMRSYISFEYQDDASYVDFLKSFYDLDITCGYATVPAFSVYDLESYNQETNTYSYTEANNILNLGVATRQLTEAQFYSVMFKVVDGQWVPRDVPGFPVPIDDVPNPNSVVSSEVYLANPQEGLLVLDGEVAIYPLRDYFMRLYIDFGRYLPTTIGWVNDQLMPAGLLVSYSAETHLVGDY